MLCLDLTNFRFFSSHGYVFLLFLGEFLMQNISSFFSLKTFLILGSLIALMCLLNAGYCANTSSGDMPWDSMFTKLRKSVKGPIAITIALLGIIGSGAALIWGGGEMGPILKGLIGLVALVAMIVLADKLLTALTGESAILEADFNVKNYQLYNIPMAGNNISKLVQLSVK